MYLCRYRRNTFAQYQINGEGGEVEKRATGPSGDGQPINDHINWTHYISSICLFYTFVVISRHVKDP